MDIHAMIANIRQWQAAQAEFKLVERDYDHIIYDKREKHREAKYKLDRISCAVTGHYINPTSTLASFVALADEIERLSSEIVKIHDIARWGETRDDCKKIETIAHEALTGEQALISKKLP